MHAGAVETAFIVYEPLAGQVGQTPVEPRPMYCLTEAWVGVALGA